MAASSSKRQTIHRAHRIHPYFFSVEKRILDCVVSFFGLIAAAPLFFVIGISIIFSSGLPIFFVQERVGLGGRIFRMYKFRTMYVGAHADQKKYLKKNQAPAPMFKIFDDPRFIGIGHFLSGTGLDELPQFWNVLRGEMSLVGPRPLPMQEAKKLGAEWQFRFAVKPGIFSQWTVSNKRHTSQKWWLKLERDTVGEGSMWGDVMTVVRTLWR